MTMRNKKTKRLLLLAVAAVVVIAGVWGGYRYMRWRHDADIESRLKTLAPIIHKHAQANSLPTELVRDVIRAESGADARAHSSRNAKGLMQLTPVAVEEVRRKTKIAEGDLFDPDYNVLVGTTYLRILVNKFDGDVYLAVAAYNMGPAKLLKARRDNPSLSGREIVEKIAPAATVRYCRTILKGQDLRLSVVPINGSA